jgi:hypothetical protein
LHERALLLRYRYTVSYLIIIYECFPFVQLACFA